MHYACHQALAPHPPLALLLLCPALGGLGISQVTRDLGGRGTDEQGLGVSCECGSSMQWQAGKSEAGRQANKNLKPKT